MYTVNVDIKKYGKYSPQDLFGMINDGLKKRLPKLLADKYYKQIISNIDQNRYGFHLSSAWLKIKEVNGWDSRPFIAEGYYRDNIEIFTKDGHLTVGFKEGKTHPRSGITYGELALLLEYGRLDKGLPARPLWRNTIEEFFADLNPTITKEIIRILDEAKKK